jgi:hypothetical protein
MNTPGTANGPCQPLKQGLVDLALTPNRERQLPLINSTRASTVPLPCQHRWEVQAHIHVALCPPQSTQRRAMTRPGSAALCCHSSPHGLSALRRAGACTAAAAHSVAAAHQTPSGSSGEEQPAPELRAQGRWVSHGPAECCARWPKPEGVPRM